MLKDAALQNSRNENNENQAVSENREEDQNAAKDEKDESSKKPCVLSATEQLIVIAEVQRFA